MKPSLMIQPTLVRLIYFLLTKRWSIPNMTYCEYCVVDRSGPGNRSLFHRMIIFMQIRNRFMCSVQASFMMSATWYFQTVRGPVESLKVERVEGRDSAYWRKIRIRNIMCCKYHWHTMLLFTYLGPDKGSLSIWQTKTWLLKELGIPLTIINWKLETSSLLKMLSREGLN